MAEPTHERLLEALLDSWDRNNAIMVGLLRALPDGALELRSTEGGASIAQAFTHMHYIRLVHVFEDAPELSRDVPETEWAVEHDADRIAGMLDESAKVVRDALKSRVGKGREMDMHYDHPILFLQHMLWHEAYHHGQIKLTLKLAGRPISDDVAGPISWGIWMDKTTGGTTAIH